MKTHRLDQKALKRGKWAGPLKTPPTANIKKRPVHKGLLHSAKVQEELNKKHPEPMTLFHKREKAGEIPAKTLPKPEVTLGQIDKAATAMAEWENSDPFAYSRTALHVKQGYLRADEVIKEMTQRTIARRVAKAREVESGKIG